MLPDEPHGLGEKKNFGGLKKQVSKQGYALDQEEFMDGMVAIAVPVKDNRGRFAAALAFHGPTQRISVENALARKDILTEAAKQLAESLFNED